MASGSRPWLNKVLFTGDVISGLVSLKAGQLAASTLGKLAGRVSSSAPLLVYGAEMKLSDVSCLLIASGKAGTTKSPAKIRIDKMEDSFMVSIDDKENNSLDPITFALLTTQMNRLKAGELEMLTPEEVAASNAEEAEKSRELRELIQTINKRTPAP